MSSSAQAASAPDSFFTAPLNEADPEIAAAIKGELGRQRHEIELIASENIVSRAVLEAQGSVMTNKYAEGYPGARYYGGCEWVDVAENLAIDRAKKLFGAGFANVQPNSGSQMNQAVFLALLAPGDTFMADARRAALKDQTDVRGARALIVEARFYDDIQDALLQGAVAELEAAGVTHDVVTVPGALEVPAAIAIAFDAAEKSGKPYDAAIALGCVVRGETFHFEIVSMESSRGLMDIAIDRRIPLGNGILTVNTDEQAWARARPGDLNKGGDAARAALAMLRLKRRMAQA